MNRNKLSGWARAHFGFRISDFGLGVDRRRRPARATALIRDPQSAIRNGFTLIELLLVLVILAALAAIVVPKIAGRGEEAKIKTAITQISMFKTTLDLFEIDCGRYPTTEEGLQALVTQPGNLQGWKSTGYLDALPKDPWGNLFIYRYPGVHNTKGFDLYSTGPSGTDGGADNITNWTAN